MAMPKSFMITTLINVNDTRPVVFQPSTFVMDNSAKSKSTRATFYEYRYCQFQLTRDLDGARSRANRILRSMILTRATKSLRAYHDCSCH